MFFFQVRKGSREMEKKVLGVWFPCVDDLIKWIFFLSEFWIFVSRKWSVKFLRSKSIRSKSINRQLGPADLIVNQGGGEIFKNKRKMEIVQLKSRAELISMMKWLLENTTTPEEDDREEQSALPEEKARHAAELLCADQVPLVDLELEDDEERHADHPNRRLGQVLRSIVPFLSELDLRQYPPQETRPLWWLRGDPSEYAPEFLEDDELLKLVTPGTLKKINLDSRHLSGEFLAALSSCDCVTHLRFGSWLRSSHWDDLKFHRFTGLTHLHLEALYDFPEALDLDLRDCVALQSLMMKNMFDWHGQLRLPEPSAIQSTPLPLEILHVSQNKWNVSSLDLTRFPLLQSLKMCLLENMKPTPLNLSACRSLRRLKLENLGHGWQGPIHWPKDLGQLERVAIKNCTSFNHVSPHLDLSGCRSLRRLIMINCHSFSSDIWLPFFSPESTAKVLLQFSNFPVNHPQFHLAQKELPPNVHLKPSSLSLHSCHPGD